MNSSISTDITMNPNASAEEILNSLRKIADQPYEKAKEWRDRTGSKIVGCYTMHFPEELIHAAGLLPIVLQVNDGPITNGHAYYPEYFCGPSRSIVDQAAKGDLNFLDGFIAGDYCIQIVGGGEVLGELLPKANNMFFRLPVGNQPWTQDDITQGLKEIRRDVERFIGKKINDQSICESIRIYNKNRSLVRRIYELKSSHPEILSSTEMMYIIKTSMVMPKEEHNKILDNLLPKIEDQLNSKNKKEGVRVFLSGGLCGAPKSGILSMIEESGAVAVGDDLFHGYRYISTNIDINDDRDPLDSIAAHYLEKNNNVPCPTRCDPESDWAQYLVDSVKKQGADRLVILMAQFCEPHMFFYPDIKEATEKAGIPHLLIEIEQEMSSLEDLRTRIEAFIEI